MNAKLKLRYEQIPSELKNLPRWVLVKNSSKIPFQANGECASSTNPDTWCDFTTANRLVEQGRFDYIGFVFSDTDGYIGIDLDKALDEDGFLNEETLAIIGKCKSYTELSRSGRGVHIIVKGSIPCKGLNNRNGMEIYSTSRYFICTGKSVGSKEIMANQEAIDSLLTEYFPEEEKESNGSKANNTFYKLDYTKPTNGKISILPKYPKCPQGTRNASMTSLAGQLHTLGYDKQSIYQELARANKEACDPPLGNNEIINIVNSICRYRR